MRKLYILAVMASLFAAVFSVQNANASSPNIVISQVQLGNAASAKNEFVQIYNNSSINVEITNWCLSYLSSSLTPREMACFTPENDSTHIFLPSYSFAIAVSNEMIAAVPPIKGDLFFHILYQVRLGMSVFLIIWEQKLIKLVGEYQLLK